MRNGLPNPRNVNLLAVPPSDRNCVRPSRGENTRWVNILPGF